MLNDKLINSVLAIAEDAGKAILAVYDEPVELTVKADNIYGQLSCVMTAFTGTSPDSKW